jgi:hypothetical protein
VILEGDENVIIQEGLNFVALLTFFVCCLEHTVHNEAKKEHKKLVILSGFTAGCVQKFAHLFWLLKLVKSLNAALSVALWASA